MLSVTTYLNLSPSCDHLSIFEPGDAGRRWTFPGHTLEEDSLSLANCLVTGTEENTLQTWDTQHKWEIDIWILYSVTAP